MCASQTGLAVEAWRLTEQVAFSTFPLRLPSPHRPLGIVPIVPIVPRLPAATATKRLISWSRRAERLPPPPGAEPAAPARARHRLRDRRHFQARRCGNSDWSHRPSSRQGLLRCTRRSVRGAGRPAPEPWPPGRGGTRGGVRVLLAVAPSSVVETLAPGRQTLARLPKHWPRFVEPQRTLPLPAPGGTAASLLRVPEKTPGRWGQSPGNPARPLCARVPRLRGHCTALWEVPARVSLLWAGHPSLLVCTRAGR